MFGVIIVLAMTVADAVPMTLVCWQSVTRSKCLWILTTAKKTPKAYVNARMPTL
ncbi:hypothetical protein FLX35_01750 [Cylindrospermopsis raciborskii LB2897]|nr:hypothetical protein [Cylindrospermopsis raciborskii LB2897]TPX28809.1 hypothetical protein FIV49_06885 [Cylindrospermopsis raciborskii GIHE 2018]